MPATSIRDLTIKDHDLVVGTHGRGFWILDDISPLRQVDGRTATLPMALFRPGDAWRVRWDEWTDTPLPPDEPAGRNPPDGAILYYWLKDAPRTPVVLEIQDSLGNVVRRFSSADTPPPMLQGQQVPPLWVRPPQVVSAGPGMHRFVWDLHYATPKGVRHGYPISAIPHDTPLEPRGPLALPGHYTVRLVVDGREAPASLLLNMDPRVKTPMPDLHAQFDLSMRIKSVLDRRDQVSTPEFRRLTQDLEGLYRQLQGSDQRPQPDVVKLTEERLAAAERILGG
jgi:hypothetical protein